MLTQERLRELLDYDPNTGVFTRRVARTCAPQGSVAGSKHSGGYLTIWIDGKSHKAHRLAWLYFNGQWPLRDMDHINGVRNDNRIANLREATRSENAQNIRSAYANNHSSGLLGVYWHRQCSKWQARIQVDGRAQSLGLFKGKDEAHAAYLTAKARVHPFSTIAAAET